MAGTSRAEDLFAELIAGGETAIDGFIAEARSEELFIDYKKSADDGNGSKLQHTDRGHLAKAISGFGNSEGGIIVWGVTCQHDAVVGGVPTGKVPISNPKQFVSWLEGAVSGCTLPPHGGVHHHAVEQASGGQGYAITYLPKSTLAPH
ncbi:MAG: AlbA family DNA-binding domain-containing protein [Bryobacteraceae bacterium]